MIALPVLLEFLPGPSSHCQTEPINLNRYQRSRDWRRRLRAPYTSHPAAASKLPLFPFVMSCPAVLAPYSRLRAAAPAAAVIGRSAPPIARRARAATTVASRQ